MSKRKKEENSEATNQALSNNTKSQLSVQCLEQEHQSQFNKIRMIESFQPQTQQSTASTLKSHTPAFDNIELRNHNEETLIAEVQSLPSDLIGVN